MVVGRAHMTAGDRLIARRGGLAAEDVHGDVNPSEIGTRLSYSARMSGLGGVRVHAGRMS